MASAATVDPEQVLRELRELWTTLAQDQAETGGVLRACAMTLVVTAGDAADADNVRQTLGVLMHHNPSRAIIVRDTVNSGAANAPEMSAHVFAECWKPFGSNQQICSEGIEITPGPGGLNEVARLLVPLGAPDLPLVLWGRGKLSSDQRRGADQAHNPLLTLADKIIFDTKEAPDAARALAYLRGLQSAGRRVADLNWTRLTGWREVIAHLFDDRALEPAAVTSVNLSYGGGRLTTSALYMAAWIRCALPDAPVIVDAVNSPARQPGGLVSIEFASSPDHLAPGHLALLRAEGDCVAVTGTGRNYHSALPPARTEDLMREELSILGHDPVYEKVLAS